MPEAFSDAARIVGERIRAVRNGLALSQEDVAELADIHPTNYGKIERGRANPSLSTVIRIADALNTDPGTFISGLDRDSLPGRHRKFTAADLIRERERHDRNRRKSNE